jgi:hypothetical protein
VVRPARQRARPAGDEPRRLPAAGRRAAGDRARSARQRRQQPQLRPRLLDLATPSIRAVRFVVEWPAEEVDLTAEEVDAALIVEAAADSERLWPEERADDERGSWTLYAP